MSALSEDLAAKGHVDGRERMGLDVLSLVVQLLIEQLIQSVVHALRTIVGVHLGAGRLPRQLWGPPPYDYPVASPLCVAFHRHQPTVTSDTTVSNMEIARYASN